MTNKAEDRYVTRAEFARRLGITRQAVNYLLKSGVIRMSTKDKDKINFNIMKKAYDNNRNMSQVRKPRAKSKAKTSKPAKVKAKKYKDDDDVRPIRNIPNMHSMGDINLEEEEYEAPIAGSLADNQNRKISAEADRHELKFAQELGDVIPTEVALMIAGDKMRSIKEAMLALPSKTTGLLVADVKTKVETWKDGELELLSNSISNILKSSIEDVLAALSASKNSLPNDVEEYFDKKR